MLRVFALVITIITFLINASPLSASEIEFVDNNFFLTTSHGKPITETVTIKNGTGQIQNVSLTWEGYKPAARHSINFVAINPTDLTLQPFASAQIELNFSPPEVILPGDYYGNLKADSDSSTAKTGFTLRILGVSEENIDIKSVSDNGSTINVGIANTGVRTTKLRLTTVIEGLFGFLAARNSTDWELKAGQGDQVELKHTSLWPGQYQADVKVEYSDGKSERTIKNIWINPKLIGLAVIIILIGSAAVITETRRKRA